MSKSRIGVAAAGVAMVALGALPSAAEAGLRLRVGGPVGVARFAMASMLSVAGLRHARVAARHSRVRTAALRPQDLRSAAESIHPSVGNVLYWVCAIAAVGLTAIMLANVLTHGADLIGIGIRS